LAFLPGTNQLGGKIKPWNLGGRSGRHIWSNPEESPGEDERWVAGALSTCAMYTCQLDQPQPFQDEEDVVKIEWPSQPRLLGNKMIFHLHNIMMIHSLSYDFCGQECS